MAWYSHRSKKTNEEIDAGRPGAPKKATAASDDLDEKDTVGAEADDDNDDEPQYEITDYPEWYQPIMSALYADQATASTSITLPTVTEPAMATTTSMVILVEDASTTFTTAILPAPNSPVSSFEEPTTSSSIPPVTSVTTASATPTPVAPYYQGTCHIHVSQWKLDFDGNYDLEVTMTDDSGYQIGYSARSGSYSDGSPLGVVSKLEDTLYCTPEDHNDYIQFGLGQQNWPSDGDFADGAVPSCSVGGWDGDGSYEYPVSHIVIGFFSVGGPESMSDANGSRLQKREMDCSFVCTWGGGSPSDGKYSANQIPRFHACVKPFELLDTRFYQSAGKPVRNH